MADDPQLADLSHDDRSTLLQQVPHELDRLGVSRSAATVDAVWAGPIGDDTQALLRVATDGGGVVLVASRAGPEHRDGATSTRPVVVDLTAVAPVAGVSDRPVAWRLRGEQGDETRRVGIVAPAGAARLEVTAGSQTFPATPDADGFVTVQVDPGAPAEVTAYAADGSLLGRSPIPRQADLTEGVALLGPAR
jgi:hypothetical protein